MAGGPYKGSGGWYHIIWTDRRGHPDHPKVKEALKTKSLGDARRKKAELEQQFFAGQHDPWAQKWYERPRPEQRADSLIAAVEEYIIYKTNQKGRKGWKTRRTAKSHGNVIRKFASFAGEFRSPESITSRDLDAFYHRNDIKSDYTRRSYQSKVRGLINWMADRGYINQTPRAEVDPPQQEIKPYIHQRDLQRIFVWKRRRVRRQIRQGYTTRGNQLWMIDAWALMARTGLRSGELLQIKTSDITGGDIIVGKSFRTKTNQQRKIPIFEGWANKVVDYYTDPGVRSKDAFLSGSEHLFGRSSDQVQRRLSEEFSKGVKSVAPRLGDKTLYDLRHTFAVWYLMQPSEFNRDFRLVQLMRIMGHSQLSTTQIYLQSIPSDERV